MTQPLESFLSVDLKIKENKSKHHTFELTKDELIVRRGQSFSIGLKFKEPYDPDVHSLTFTTCTGTLPDENRGTKSVFGVPDVKRSAAAKAVWRAEIDQSETGSVVVAITPPADAPVGKYSLFLHQSLHHTQLGTVSVLFNPWCPEDSVYMEKEAERQEYVMNENGLIYRGSGNYISAGYWDFGQFEDEMVEICLRLLNVSPKHFKNPAEDESSYCDPVYVSRVISAMINSAGDMGVLEGRWSGNYAGGVNPSHWSGSYPILKRWLLFGCRAVKYGQCWVFAGVMCSVMRLLGIPCRVVTNFQSAHDCNENLVIDVYHAGYGVREPPSRDSVWNFHVWVEAWMKRPDLPPGFDGWQVVDPTPQELSDGVYCCGPAPVEAVLKGLTNLEYDVPFVFAEVNADRIDWLVQMDGSKRIISTDTSSVGQNISTKSVGSNIREDLTDKYKYREGTYQERAVFRYAVFQNSRGDSFWHSRGRSSGGRSNTVDESANDVPQPMEMFSTPSSRARTAESANIITVERVETQPETPKVSMKFEEVSKLVNGKDVKLNLVLHSEATEPRPLSINISAKAKSYNGTAQCDIQAEQKEDTLLPGKDLCIPVVVPFSKYWKPMLDYDAMKVSALVSDALDSSEVYLAETDVVLVDPHIEIKTLNEAQVNQQQFVEVAFMNPVCETLKNCTLSVSGSGLLEEEQDISLPSLGPNRRVRVKLYFSPYKSGQKTLVVNFNCSVFRDIKSFLPIHVKHSNI